MERAGKPRDGRSSLRGQQMSFAGANESVGRRQNKMPGEFISSGISLLQSKPQAGTWPDRMNYKGENQGYGMCVFASASAAVNFVARKTVWTQYTLLDQWKRQGIEQVHFTNIIPVAIQPVKDCVKWQHHCDSVTKLSNQQYLEMLKKCVDAGGIAIVSLELADHVDSQLKRKDLWHMLSLIGRNGDKFTTWDTAGANQGVVSTDQLVSHFPYGDGLLAVHNEHDVFLIQPNKNGDTASNQAGTIKLSNG